MFKRTLFATLAAMVVCINVAGAQTPSKPVEPGTVKQDAQKPVVITIKEDTVLIDDVPLGGDPWFPDGTLFLDDTMVDGEMIGKNEMLKGGGTAKKLAKLPKGMKLLPGTKLTLPPGGKLPEPPVVPEPKRVQIGKRAVMEDKFDSDPKLQNAALKYSLSKIAELEGRVSKVEKEIVEIKKKLTPEEKAQRLRKKPTGEYHWDTSACVSRVTVNGVWHDLGSPTQHPNGSYYYAILAN